MDGEETHSIDAEEKHGMDGEETHDMDGEEKDGALLEDAYLYVTTFPHLYDLPRHSRNE